MKVARAAGSVLFAWLVFVAVEHLVVGFGWRTLFVGTWEMGAARKYVTPVLLAALVVPAFVAALLGELAARGDRRWLAVAGGVPAAALAIGVTHGRHFASLAARIPFVAVLASAGAAFGWLAVPRLARAAIARPRAAAVAGASLAAMAWLADELVLPRLYPAFHLALFALALAGAALPAMLVVRVRVLPEAALVLALACAAWTPIAAKRLSAIDNLRLVLVDHAPLLGRGVAIAARIAPPPPLDDDSATSTLTSAALSPGEIPRALDWTGRDVVLISVDALRADHVGAYGYRRPTTPAIDRLAKEGTLFESAYCPTPHTSYSVTSMMTGKYMRPLLSVGLGEDSDTWAALLRRYGYRTAAFYPPAVFFIDEERFVPFRDRGLDFEYRKVEFAGADLRATQVVRYLEAAPPARPLFLWVHLFEPHEPYVAHPEHVFGSGDYDDYDSEIAAADEGIGRVVDAVHAKRPRAVVIVTADHGEEFGEHGGRYHGTTVYEEQVHVPLVVAGEGIAKGRVAEPVQTIDLLPTTLSALGIPRPARIRGRDLGPLLKGGTVSPGPGLAFAETDDYTLVARGTHRLVCNRRAAACALYDPKADPLEQRDLSAQLPDEAKELRRMSAQIARAHGQFETGAAQGWPEALRRGMQGDADAAEEVASLLEDVRADVRRKAAEVTFDLHAPAAAPQARRGAKEDDPDVRRWCALALVRMGAADPDAHADAILHDADPAWRRRAALAFAEQGDARGEGDLAAWLDDVRAHDFARAKEIVAALGKIRARAGVPPLVRALEDLRLRPFAADALGAIGDPSAKAPLLAAFASERYVSTRPHEARALVALGAREELRAPLARFAGVPDPMPEAIAIADDAKLLDRAHGGWSSPAPLDSVRTSLKTTGTAPARLVVRCGKPLTVANGEIPTLVFDGLPMMPSRITGDVAVFDLPAASTAARAEHEIWVTSTAGGVRALWLVARAAEIPPPPPEPWDAGPENTDVDPQAPPK